MSTDPTWLHMRPGAASPMALYDCAEFEPDLPFVPYLCWRIDDKPESVSERQLEAYGNVLSVVQVEARNAVLLLVKTGEPEQPICGLTKQFTGPLQKWASHPPITFDVLYAHPKYPDHSMVCFAPMGHEGFHIGCDADLINERGVWLARFAIVPERGVYIRRTVDIFCRAEKQEHACHR